MRQRKLTYLLAIFLCSCNEDPGINLGNNYKLAYSAQEGDPIIVTDKGIRGDAPTQIIGGKVLNFAFDSTFIVVVQKDRDSIMPRYSNLSQADQAFFQSPLKQYWIIDKRAKLFFDTKTKKYSNVYGPYDKKEYEQMRTELSVPLTLDLGVKD
ncbi:hypothetical protein LLH06_08150 [Mucilaginibacter daejeonensis]|uniref:hypothetical protein n=1 Tax=Mucilaginibacter daejeonensis TaxID=398049 RepID=UPI001D176B78|nr:hypothetical protein [Mucilaginibacter daejeonensis]UEG54935.1 hypothetical protein LLH06_08150 [Mucilaginibacter daejeonensis]